MHNSYNPEYRQDVAYDVKPIKSMAFVSGFVFGYLYSSSLRSKLLCDLYWLHSAGNCFTFTNSKIVRNRT